VIRRLSVVATLLLGCRATTTRPTFVEFPEAETAELGFGLVSIPGTVARLTDTLVEYLRRDSIPVTTVQRFDGYLDTGWFDAKTFKPTSRRPLGDGVVRVRGWVNPGKPGYGRVEVETVYRPVADPSLPARELEAPVAPSHAVNAKVLAVLQRLKVKYGAPEDSAATKNKDGKPPVPGNGPPGPPGQIVPAPVVEKPGGAKADTIKADTAKRTPPPVPKADTTAAKKRDTTAIQPAR
jgi:hypothetical protein